MNSEAFSLGFAVHERLGEASLPKVAEDNDMPLFDVLSVGS
jgi:hypothetical protein